MFGHSYFGKAYYGPAYWGPHSTTPIGSRRGRRKRRYYQDVLQEPEKHNQDVVDQAKEVESARNDLEIARLMMQKGKDKIERLSILEMQVSQAEAYLMQLMDEEELFLLILAISA